eukprot:Skav236108  [mRNA]  locus=scaffold1166:382662:391729:+ [translate_table: standard]
MTDQFISAGEHKWLQQSGLVMLLPHGYMGQGAEHSSCRIERFLQLSDDDEVMNLSTPANYFHALRRQQHRDFRKPMVVASPKNLFRLRQCVSPLSDMELDTRFQRLIGERDPEIAEHPDKVDRLVFCSGKIYYELVAERERLGLKNVAIITLEQLAPFPFDRVKQVMEKYSHVDVGDGVHPGQLVTTAREGFHKEKPALDLVMRYIGRRAAASPATGNPKLHNAEQEAVLREGLWMGVVDHHTLVYESRRICKDGLFFEDGFEDSQLETLSEKKYDIVKWNCQQFCSEIFDEIPEVFAGGGVGSFGA